MIQSRQKYRLGCRLIYLKPTSVLCPGTCMYECSMSSWCTSGEARLRLNRTVHTVSKTRRESTPAWPQEKYRLWHSLSRVGYTLYGGGGGGFGHTPCSVWGVPPRQDLGQDQCQAQCSVIRTLLHAANYLRVVCTLPDALFYFSCAELLCLIPFERQERKRSCGSMHNHK